MTDEYDRQQDIAAEGQRATACNFPFGPLEPGYLPHPTYRTQYPLAEHFPTVQRGCICPPGANKECQATMCPRQPTRERAP